MSLTSTSQSHFDQLLEQNLQQFAEAFRLTNLPYMQPVLNRVFMSYAQYITQTTLGYDQQISHRGLIDASDWLLERFHVTVQAYATENIPKQGPLLVVSNHPGMTDVMAIFTTLGRDDMYGVAERNPILNLIPSVHPYVVFVKEHNKSALGAVRDIAQLLKDGNTVILFPAGDIEPDPALRSTAPESLPSWSRSIALFAKLVPDLQILPVAVGGVISRSATRHPLTKLYRTQARRDWVAATLMIMYERYRHVTVSVRYGAPIQTTPDSVQDAVSNQMTHLIMQTWQESKLSAKI